jgi:hypothetical protein
VNWAGDYGVYCSDCSKISSHQCSLLFGCIDCKVPIVDYSSIFALGTSCSSPQPSVDQTKLASTLTLGSTRICHYITLPLLFQNSFVLFSLTDPSSITALSTTSLGLQKTALGSKQCWCHFHHSTPHNYDRYSLLVSFPRTLKILCHYTLVCVVSRQEL